eukprot:74133-Prorocentrum_minimum.AAC.2
MLACAPATSDAGCSFVARCVPVAVCVETASATALDSLANLWGKVMEQSTCNMSTLPTSNTDERAPSSSSPAI